jgi:glycosyltransferase involved in cell wall biosynthesis
MPPADAAAPRPPHATGTRLRVLLVLPGSSGGIGRHVHSLAEGLVQRGHAVTVCGPPLGETTFGFTSTGATFIPVPVGTAAPASLVRARRALHDSSHEHDVVHAHGVRAGALAATATDRPVVTTWHNAPLGGPSRHAVHALLERVCAHRSAVILGASADLVERARRAGAADARFGPIAVSTPRRKLGAARNGDAATAASGAAPYLLAVARLAPQKRLDLLVEATRGWLDQPGRPRVLVAGDGPLRAQLEARAAALRSPVTFLGRRDDVAELLESAMALVLTSDWEARPLVVQEALPLGVPVVVTDVGGVRDLVGDGGFLVERGDAAAVRAAIERLVDDPALRASVATKGRIQASTWPTVEMMLDRIEELYLDLTSR